MTLQQLFQHPLAVAAFVALWTTGFALWARGRDRQSQEEDKEGSELEMELKGKVDKEDCLSFRRRIGKESDDHREHINDLKDDISDIKENVGWIRGKLE